MHWYEAHHFSFISLCCLCDQLHLYLGHNSLRSPVTFHESQQRFCPPSTWAKVLSSKISGNVWVSAWPLKVTWFVNVSYSFHLAGSFFTAEPVEYSQILPQKIRSSSFWALIYKKAYKSQFKHALRIPLLTLIYKSQITLNFISPHCFVSST